MQVQDEKPYDEINITPMLDLAYVLLVIFILMTTATVTGLKANLPRASANAPSQKESKTKTITVNNNGSMVMDGLVVTLPDLEQKLKAHKTANPDFPVVIRGDSATAWQSIVDVVEVTTSLGITKVGLPTKARQ